jgi:hypothetical protein
MEKMKKDAQRRKQEKVQRSLDTEFRTRHGIPVEPHHRFRSALRRALNRKG